VTGAVKKLASGMGDVYQEIGGAVCAGHQKDPDAMDFEQSASVGITRTGIGDG